MRGDPKVKQPHGEHIMAVRYFNRFIHLPSNVPCHIQICFLTLTKHFDVRIKLSISGLFACDETKINLFFSDLEAKSVGLEHRLIKAIEQEAFQAKVCQEIYEILICGGKEGFHNNRLIDIISNLLPCNKE